MKQFLNHESAPVMCPPGALVPKPASSPTTLVLASSPRSGTHVLLDLVLNNFRAYKRGGPLYIGFDKGTLLPGFIDEVSESRGYVISTHYPPAREGASTEAIDQLFANRPVISSFRRFEARNRSSEVASANVGGFDESEEERYDADQRFNEYWGAHRQRLVFPFERLIDRSETQSIVDEIASHLDLEPNRKLVLPPRRDQRAYVYGLKALTRVFGWRAPIVNTTIGFAKKAPKRSPLRLPVPPGGDTLVSSQ